MTVRTAYESMRQRHARPWVAHVGVLVVLVALLGASSPVSAHDRRVGHAFVRVDGRDVRVTLHLRALDVTAFAASFAPEVFTDPRALDRAVARRLTVRVGDRGCARVGGPAAAGQVEGRVVVELDYRCPSRGTPRLVQSIHRVLAGYALVVEAEVATPQGSTRLPARVLGEREPSMLLAGDPHRSDGFFTFIGLGASHLASGADHLAFLAVLLIGGRRVRDALLAVTGFTLGHALTLALVVLDFGVPDAGRVEILVAGSILVAAVAEARGSLASSGDAVLAHSNPWRAASALPAILPVVALLATDPRAALAASGVALFGIAYLARPVKTSRIPISFAFGLVHGLAFSSVLTELALAPAERPLALLGFNLGLEFVQALVALLFVPLLAFLGRKRRARELLEIVVLFAASSYAALLLFAPLLSALRGSA